jgi:formylglycine-generating enzyme required for sulfatase activity
MSEKSARIFSVFLCHASDDKQRIRELYKNLANEGIDVWSDEKLLPGQDWELEISKALKEAHAIIICFSKKSISKEGFIQKEIKHALDIAEEKPEGTIFLIPARLEDCVVPGRFTRIQYVDLYDPDGYQKLLLSLSIRAKSLELPLTGKKSVQEPLPAVSYELSQMLKGMLGDDQGFREAMSHLAEREPEGNGWFHREIHEGLQKIMGDPSLPIKERTKAGDVIAQLGDPRFRSDAWYLPDDDFLGFVEIPAGPFLMGMGAKKSDTIFESPQHQVDLPTYYMNRYPVTVSQYQAFLRETNSAHKNDSKDAGLGNRPVVFVTWHDAMQYCRWLTEMLRTWSDTPSEIADRLNNLSWTVTLPSEAEWEKAARGVADARIYPWGILIDPQQANYNATQLGCTSAVGCFESGKSPYGIYDMSGNAWEWTRSAWGPSMDGPRYRYPYIKQDGRENLKIANDILKVIRGGAYLSSQEDIECSHRDADFPNANNRDHIGFRLAITSLIE